MYIYIKTIIFMFKWCDVTYNSFNYIIKDFFIIFSFYAAWLSVKCILKEVPLKAVSETNEIF